MAYADDVLIMGKSLQDVKEVFSSLVEQINRMRLQINKRQFMISREPYNENKYVKLRTYTRIVFISINNE